MAAGAARLSAGLGVTEIPPEVAALIDHTLLKPEATREQVLKLCEEAKQFDFASVCLNPYWVPLAAVSLRGTAVKVCTVVGFPLGATLPQVKAYETEQAVKLGAQEIDMVITTWARSSQATTIWSSRTFAAWWKPATPAARSAKSSSNAPC